MIAGILDRLINLLKWPCAVWSVWVLFPASQSAYEIVINSLDKTEVLIPLFAGGFAYLVTSRIIVGKKKQGWFSTLEHELTHAFFALITFHKVNGIQTTANQGGVIEIQNGNNWLIIISPYFFPTFSFFFIFLFSLVDAHNKWVTNFLLGCTVAYHLISTVHELHRHQTDLQQTGFVFATIFLPGANLICYGTILAFAINGTGEMMSFIKNSLMIFWILIFK